MQKELKPIWSTAASKVGEKWCELAHDAAMWPIHGQYQCRTCGRNYPVQWSGPPLAQPASAVLVPQMRPVTFRPAFLWLLVLLSILMPSRAQAASRMADPAGPAAIAFARYIAGLPQTTPWSIETIDLDASLPGMAKQGRLRVVRRLLPVGKPQYKVVNFTGDQTVKEQVIFRYLTADSKSADVPADSVAITPANYKFSYQGVVKTAGATRYSFSIKPRKKRVGLIKGQLLLDGETGEAVRESGYLVKSPSIFIKRVTVTREKVIRDGCDVERVTHLSIDTRLVGQAELTVRERPGTDLDDAPVAY